MYYTTILTIIFNAKTSDNQICRDEKLTLKLYTAWIFLKMTPKTIKEQSFYLLVLRLI